MGLRELLLLITVAAVCIGSIVQPRIALYGYLWYGLMRPDILAFAEAKYPISLVLAGLTGIAALRSSDGLPALFRSPTARLLLFLQVPLWLSYVLAVNPALSAERYDFYVRMIVILFFVPVMVRTLDHLRELLLVLTFSVGIIGVKFGSYGILHGGVALEGGYGNVFDDNNFLALALAMVIPLAWHGMALVENLVARGALLGIIALSIAQVIMSHSRGGSLALGVGLMLMLMRTRRKFISAIVVVSCVGVAIYMVQDTYFARMDTLRAPDEEASAASRITHAKAAFDMWKDYPILGVGFGGFNYAALAPNYQSELDGAHVAHNSYLQMLVDSGILAFTLYIWILAAAIIRMGRSGRRWRSLNGPLSGIPYGIQTALVIFVIGAIFYSCHRMDFPYMILMCAACWENIEPTIIEQYDHTDILYDAELHPQAR